MEKIQKSIRCISSAIFLLWSAAAAAQRPPDICEGAVPRNWTAKAGSLQMSTRHYKAGTASVQWQWKKAGAAVVIKDTAFGSVAANPRSTFVVWIYNETPLDDKITFRFAKGAKTATSFDFYLNFTGWRTAWVMYHRDMKGRPVPGMNTLTITAPRSAKTGSLYFDQVLYNVTINPRSPMQDEQVPSVNVESYKAANAHWTALYRFSHTPHAQPLPATVSAADKKAMETITRRFQQFIFPAPRKGAALRLEEAVAAWNIHRQNGVITGRPVLSVNDPELLPEAQLAAAKNSIKDFSVKAYTELMLKLAAAYTATEAEPEKSRLGKLFLDMVDHLDDQGWAAGSGMGALHHLGYNFRDYYTACLLMKPLLKDSGRLQRTIKTMAWFSGLGRTQAPPDSITESNIDVFNTLLNGMVSTILMMDDSPEKVRQLREFSAWLSKTLEPTLSIDGTFKPDGSVVHHGNLYPVYGVGGLQGVTPIVYTLSQTPFQVKEKGHKTVRHVLLTMHRYTNPYRWPISVSGRHPTGNWAIADEPFAYMAMAGTPDGAKALDDTMAAIYLLLNPEKTNAWTRQFRQADVSPAHFPTGHWDINYGLLSIHRRADWLLTVRGHNRYFTTHEAYPGANVFGRYLTYGHLEVTFPQTKESSGSNFRDEGWDWASIPGTTTLKVPVDSLRAHIINADDFSGVEEMLLSDEIFAGGINYKGQQGLFAMKLHGHDKYNMGSFRATKSYFMFDSLVVCLGSNISNTRRDAPTVTTLFQNVLDSTGAPFYLQGAATTAFPLQQQWTGKTPLSVIDNRGIGYYLPEAAAVQFSKKEQQSRDQTDSRNTKGPVALLQIDHGHAPAGVGYEYAMLVGATPEALGQMAAQKPYTVLQQDSIAHIVRYSPQNLTGLALFAAGGAIRDSFIQANSRPCLLLYKPEGTGMELSVVDPDLQFYTGPDDSPLLPDGKRKEVSIYSRSWYGTPSKPSVVVLEVKGHWRVANAAAGVVAMPLPNGNTKLTIPCRYGLTTGVSLTRGGKTN